MLSITKWDKRDALRAIQSVYDTGAINITEWSDLVGMIDSVQVGHPVAPLGPKVIDVVPRASEIAEPSSAVSRVDRIIYRSSD